MSSFLHPGLGFTPGLFGGHLDSDVAAFFTQARANGGSYSPQEESLVNTFVASLKAEGIWSKMNFIWLPVGANLLSSRAVLKHPSLPTGSLLTYNGYVEGNWNRASGLDGRAEGLTISTGATPFGFAPNSNDAHLSVGVVSAASGSGPRRDIGSGTIEFNLFISFNNLAFFRTGGTSLSARENVSNASPVATGLWVSSQDGVSPYIYGAGNELLGGATHVKANVTHPNSGEMFINRANTALATQTGRKELDFASSGLALTRAEAAKLTIIYNAHRSTRLSLSA